jgi:hypothetical protein
LIQRAAYGALFYRESVGVNHRGADIGVPKQGLNDSYVIPILEQVSRKCVAQTVGCCRLVDLGVRQSPLERSLESLVKDVMSRYFAALRIH